MQKLFWESGAVDAVIVATAHYDHPILAIKAFEKGLHVMIEKPQGLYKAGQSNERAAERSGKFLVLCQPAY
jgi:predicted dehydrogenase